MMTPPPQAPDDDLAWLAFRYVAGELDPEESAAFEHRLDREQPAREAVAEAVALVAGISPRGAGIAVNAVVEIESAESRDGGPRLGGVPGPGGGPSAGRVPAPRQRDRTPVPPRPAAGSAVALAWSGLPSRTPPRPRARTTRPPRSTTPRPTW